MTQATEWTDAQHRAYRRAKRESEAESLARRIGRALAQAVALMDEFTGRHGGGCPCGFCRPDEDSTAAGALLYDWFMGCQFVLEQLLDTVEGETESDPAADPDVSGPDADAPALVAALGR